MLEGILYRLRSGIAWQDLPDCFGSWQPFYTWHHRMATDGTWEVFPQRLLAQADAEGLIDWSVSVDSTINRAHQHATNITGVPEDFVELQQPVGRAARPCPRSDTGWFVNQDPRLGRWGRHAPGAAVVRWLAG